MSKRQWDGKKPPPRPGLGWKPNSAYWQRRDAMEQLGASCVCCGTKDWSRLEIDHIVPPALDENGKRAWDKGGIYNAALEGPERFQLLCRSCNRRKRRGPACTHNWRVDLNSPKFQRIAEKVAKLKNGG